MVYLHVLGIRLALIPNNTIDGVFGKRPDGRIVKIGGLIGVHLQLIRCARNVLSHALHHPRHNHYVVFKAVVQQFGIVIFKRLAVYPSLSRTSAHSVDNDTDWHPQTFAQYPSEIIGHGRHLAHVFRRGLLPAFTAHILQVIGRIERRLRPFGVVGIPSWQEV